MAEGTTDNVQQDFQHLKRRSVKGMVALLVRQVLVKGIFIIGNILLARLLEPQIFGIYAIVQFIVLFFSTFGDVGIGAALIQKKGELSREELSTTFWLQQMLVLSVVTVVMLAAPLALKVYPSLPPVGVWLIRAMALSFLFSSLKTIPAILMERSIDFNRIAWVDITESVAYQGVAVVCAYLGYGVWSFIVAAITRTFLGAVLIYSLSSWRPGFCYRFESVRGLVRFGLPYQGNQILSFVKDAVTPLFVGAYAGAAAVGYLNWSRNFAFVPLMLSETFGRVAFPAFSKLQDDRALLQRTVERSIRMMTLLMFPVTGAMLALAPEVTHIVFTDKWLPGINAFYLFCMSPAFIGLFLPLYSAILALGNSAILLKMSVALLLLEWGLAVPLVMKFGFVGVAMTQPVTIGIFTNVYNQVLKKNNIMVGIVRNTGLNFIFALLATGTIIRIKAYMPVSPLSLIVAGIAYFLVYGTLVILFNGNALSEIISYVKMVLGTSKSEGRS